MPLLMILRAFCLLPKELQAGCEEGAGGPPGRHHGKPHRAVLMSCCTLKLISCGLSRKETLPHSGRVEKKGKERQV